MVASQKTNDPNWEFLGFTIGPAGPIQRVDIRWQPGMTVLYGPNGAGKSTLLNTVVQVVSGRAELHRRGWLHLLVKDTSQPLGSLVGSPFERALAAQLLEFAKWWDLAMGSADWNEYRDLVEVGWGASWPPWLPSSVEHDDPEGPSLDSGSSLSIQDALFLVSLPSIEPDDDLLERLKYMSGVGILSAEAVGRDDPRWRVWLSYREEDLSAQLRQRRSESLALRLAEEVAPALHNDFYIKLAEVDGDRETISHLLDRLHGSIVSEVMSELVDILSNVGERLSAVNDLLSSLEEGKAEAARSILEEREEILGTVTEWLSTLEDGEVSHDRLYQQITRLIYNERRHDEGFWRYGFHVGVEDDDVWLDRHSELGSGIAGWAVHLYCPVFETPYLDPPWLVADLHQDVDDRTESALLDEPYGSRSLPSGNTPAPLIRPKTYEAFQAQARPHLKKLESAANRFLEAFGFNDSFYLEVLLTGFHGMRRGRRLVHWQAVDVATTGGVELEGLSASQQRWARLAVEYAIASQIVPHDISLIVIDEPELALHRAKAQKVARSLTRSDITAGMPVLVSSHSAPFIDQPDSRLVHVSRNARGFTSAEMVEMASLAEIAEILELSPSELLQLVKAFVIVEGDHDKAVLEVMLGDEFEAQRAVVLPMRGTKNLNESIEARLIFDYTSAAVIVVLDAIHNVDLIAEKWEKIFSDSISDTGARAVLADLRTKLTSLTDEESKLLEFARVAVDSGKHHRIRLFGFEKKDIIEYFPPESFGLETDWKSLHDSYEKAYVDRAKTMTFKQWLNNTKGAEIRTETVREAAQRLSTNEISPEFAALLNLIVAANL